MPVQVVTSDADFLGLRECWQELFLSNPCHTPFQTWEWNYSWWRRFGAPGQLRLLLARDRGRLIGIAPLYLSKFYRGLPLRHLAFISTKRADYLDFLVVPGAEELFFQKVFKFLQGDAGSWGMLDLRDIAEGSGNLPFLLQIGSAALPCFEKRPSENCATVPLPDSWPAYLGRLGKNARRNAVRYARQLEERFSVRWSAASGIEEAQACFPHFVQVFRRRWQPEQGRTLFDDPRMSAFETDVCRLGSQAGWYRIFLLYVDDAPVAGYLGYVCNNKFYAGLLAHTPEMQKHSVGTVLIGRTIEHCIAQGWSELDMTRGNEPYKFQWDGRVKRNYWIKLSSSRSALAYARAIDSSRQRLQRIPALRRLQAAVRRIGTDQDRPDHHMSGTHADRRPAVDRRSMATHDGSA